MEAGEVAGTVRITIPAEVAWNADALKETVGKLKFAATDAFAGYLVANGIRVPQLFSILEFERAARATMRDGVTRIVKFNAEPLEMLRALANGVLLDEPTAGDYEIELTDGGPITIGAADATRTVAVRGH